MATKVDEIKQKPTELVTEGLAILRVETFGEHEKEKGGQKARTAQEIMPTVQSYQHWYSKALPVVKQLLPDRYQEFQDQYKLAKRKEGRLDYLTYTISDYLLGLNVTDRFTGEELVNRGSVFQTKFQHQILILQSAQSRLDSILSDIEGVLQAELFDTELDASRELFKKGHLRPAGALAGVTLETHLGKVSANHSLKVSKKDPTVSDLNDQLKNNGVYDVPTWRFIQRLGDIRNLCVHHKKREPTKEEVDELNTGVEKTVKTLF